VTTAAGWAVGAGGLLEPAARVAPGVGAAAGVQAQEGSPAVPVVSTPAVPGGTATAAAAAPPPAAATDNVLDVGALGGAALGRAAARTLRRPGFWIGVAVVALIVYWLATR